MAFAGKTTFNPATDAIPLPDGREFRFTPPESQDLPTQGFDHGRHPTTAFVDQTFSAFKNTTVLDVVYECTCP